MPKVRGPLFSLEAIGKFRDSLIYRRGGIVTRYFKPRNPKSEAQEAHRLAFKEYYMAALTQAQADLLYAAILHSHDHGGLLGLDDDDHPHYFNQARGDARYSLLDHAHRADGWTPVTDSWSYASASTISVPSGAASIYSVGDMLKMTNSGVKQNYVSSVADTVLGVVGDGVANAAISGIYYSKAANPLGFKHWFDYSATLSGSGGSAGTYAENLYLSRFSVVGRTCTLQLSKQITNKGSWSGTVYVQKPFASVSSSYGYAYVMPYASITPRAWGLSIAGSTLQFRTAFGASTLDWSTIAVNDYVVANFQFDI